MMKFTSNSSFPKQDFLFLPCFSKLIAKSPESETWKSPQNFPDTHFRIVQIHPFLFMLASPVLIWNLIGSGLDCYRSLLSGLDMFHLGALPSAPTQLRSKSHTTTNEVFLKDDSGISFSKRRILSHFPLLNKLTQDTP